VPTVRLIDADGSNKGVVDTRDAIDMARRKHLDLIEVAPNSDPPVCRIFDFGRFQYEREKKEREAKKMQKQFELKGVRIRPKTSDHHLTFKIRAARRFLAAGNKVKIQLKFKGREDRLLHVAERMMRRVVAETADLALVEVPPSMEAKTMNLVLAPTAATLAAANLKSTQDRIQAERAEDEAQGFAEEAVDLDADTEEDDDDDDETTSAEQPAPIPVERLQEHKEREKKLANREKTRNKRAEEQYGLP